MQTEDKPPQETPFDRIGGEPKVQALVDRFYDLMDLEPKYAALRAAHGSHLERARQNLFWFLCGWLGGPQHYTDRFGHPRLRARHMPFKIGILERDQWLACMDEAMGDVGIDEALRARLRESFHQTADWMRNAPGGSRSAKDVRGFLRAAAGRARRVRLARRLDCWLSVRTRRRRTPARTMNNFEVVPSAPARAQSGAPAR